MIDVIYLDVDGVLGDFISTAFVWHGIEPGTIAWPRGESDMAKVLGISNKEFLDGIDDEDFWANIFLAPGGPEIFAAVTNFAKQYSVDVVIASQYPMGYRANFELGRETWLARHGFDTIPRTYNCSSQTKVHLASPTALLIDDMDDNCEYFRRAGGMTFQPAREWNRFHSIRGTHNNFEVDEVEVLTDALLAYHVCRRFEAQR